MSIIADFTTATIKETHIYADGTSGNDSNNGLTSSTPVQTLQRAFDLIPDRVDFNTCLHLIGDFAGQSRVKITKHLADDAILLVDGGSDTTIIDGPYTVDASSTVSQLDVSIAGWTVDEHKGFWIEFTSGPLSGEMRLIQKNSATALTPVKDFSAEPDGCDFNIVRPTTMISGNTSLVMFGNSGWGLFKFQRFYADTTGAFLAAANCSTRTQFTHCIIDSDNTLALAMYYSGNIMGHGVFVDPVTFAANTDDEIGLSSLKNDVAVYNANSTYFQACVLNGLKLFNTGFGSPGRILGKGTRINGAEFNNCNPNGPLTDVTIAGTTGYAKTLIDKSSGSGLVMRGTSLSIGSDVVISDNTDHGISLDNCKIVFIGVVEGTGNGGAGLYAKNNSIVTVDPANLLTITGASGDITTNEISEDATWAEIDSGLELDIQGKLQAKEV